MPEHRFDTPETAARENGCLRIFWCARRNVSGWRRQCNGALGRAARLNYRYETER
jgi:hypothetical protein